MVVLKEEQIKEEMTQQKAINNQELTLRVQIVAFRDADEDLICQAKQNLINVLSGLILQFVDKDPLAIYFASGGSEYNAITAISERSHILLLAFANNNAYASATEVKAYMSNQGKSSWLCNLSENSFIPKLKEMIGIWTKVRNFTHKRIGIIGKPSEWLVYSRPTPEELRIRFGMRLTVFPWEDLPNPLSIPQSEDFLETFNGHGKTDFEDHSRVHTLLQTIIEDNKLDGIAVECFPMVRDKGITACLSLGRLNQIGIPAACEGDLLSLAGMILIQQLTGIIPWMANLSGVFEEHAELSHCTISPSMVGKYDITSHFETNKGLSIAGVLNNEEYTIFRWNQGLDQCFISKGIRIDHSLSKSSCRTQLHLKLITADLIKLQNQPLGNHHLIVPGNFTHVLRTACEYLNFTVI